MCGKDWMTGGPGENEESALHAGTYVCKETYQICNGAYQCVNNPVDYVVLVFMWCAFGWILFSCLCFAGYRKYFCNCIDLVPGVELAKSTYGPAVKKKVDPLLLKMPDWLADCFAITKPDPGEVDGLADAEKGGAAKPAVKK